MPAPRVGLRFLHARILDAEHLPAMCTVTDIKDQVVYYRIGSERTARHHVALDRWPRIFKRSW